MLYGNTPLHHACNVNIAELLVKHGASVEAVNKVSECTSIHTTVYVVQ